MLRKSDAAKLRVTGGVVQKVAPATDKGFHDGLLPCRQPRLRPVTESPCQHVVADGHAALVGEAADMPFLSRGDLGADILGAPLFLGRKGCMLYILFLFCHKHCLKKGYK